MPNVWSAAKLTVLDASPPVTARQAEPADSGGVLRGLARWLRAWFIAALLSGLASAQLISVGITGGVPVSPHSQDDGLGCTNRGPLICGPNDLLVKPYAIGPTVDIHIFRGVSVEAGLLYERFHKDFIQGLAVPHGGPVNFGQQYSASANGWLFPLLLKYNFGRRRIVPFADAGATLRHLGPFDGRGVQVDFYLQPQPTSVHIESGRDLDVAITAGAGVRWRLSVIDVAPEVRFLHWTEQNYQPVQNQAMLMLGLTFPAQR